MRASPITLLLLIITLVVGSQALVVRPVPRALLRRGVVTVEAEGRPMTAPPKVVNPWTNEAPRSSPAKKKKQSKRREREEESPPYKEREKMDAPMCRLMLLGDEEYEKTHVVQACTKVCKGLSTVDAEKCFDEAQKHEKAELVVTSQELGEAYVLALCRMDPIVYAIAYPFTGDQDIEG